MSTALCITCPTEELPEATLPKTIAASLQNLRDERLRAFAEMPLRAKTGNQPTALESKVDDLLDSLYTLHRLEQLAAYSTRGGQITVDADLLLIAENHEMFSSLVERFASDQPVIVSSLVLSATPRLLE